MWVAPHQGLPRGPTRGRKCYVTPAFLGVPKQVDKIRSGYFTPNFSGAHKWAEVLCSRGCPNKWTKSEVATAPLSSRGPTRGRKCHATPCILGVPKQGDNIKSGNLTPAFSGAHKGAEALHSRGPQTRGKIRRAPRIGDEIKGGYITPAFLGFPIARGLYQPPRTLSLQRGFFSTGFYQAFQNSPSITFSDVLSDFCQLSTSTSELKCQRGQERCASERIDILFMIACKVFLPFLRASFFVGSVTSPKSKWTLFIGAFQMEFIAVFAQ